MHMLILFTCKTKHIRHADSPSKEWEALHGGSWEAPGKLLRIGILLGKLLKQWRLTTQGEAHTTLPHTLLGE